MLQIAALAVELHNLQAHPYLGSLGQARTDLFIYKSPSTSSSKLYRVQHDEYLVAEPSGKRAWRKILLKSGKYGYAQSSKVDILPYSVTGKPPTRSYSRAPLPSGKIDTSELLDFIDIPAKKGGTSLTDGMGDVEFVMRIFSKAKISLPPEPWKQAEMGTPINRLEDLLPGDRVYFWGKDRIESAGIYLAGGYYIHADLKKGRVVSDYMGEKKLLNKLIAARRDYVEEKK